MDYNQTVHLPQTDFPMRAGLPKREPDMLQAMYDHDLYHKMVARNEGKPKFVLHDGPPYANGNIHIGTALNKILKDMIVKHKNMTGHCAPYVPGWDTHGLPIESAVLKDKKVKRDEMTTAQFRTKCREYAEGYIAKMTEQFQRLGVLGEWENPYITLLPEFEAKQIEVFGKMAEKGLIYKGMKPVYWCPADQTALAEAEIEYADDPCTTIFVKFPVLDDKGKLGGLTDLSRTYFVIWTTTPWTIPGNYAICLNAEFDYVLLQVPGGDVYVLAKDLAESVRTGDHESCLLLCEVCSSLWIASLCQSWRNSAVDDSEVGEGLKCILEFLCIDIHLPLAINLHSLIDTEGPRPVDEPCLAGSVPCADHAESPLVSAAITIEILCEGLGGIPEVIPCLDCIDSSLFKPVSPVDDALRDVVPWNEHELSIHGSISKTARDYGIKPLLIEIRRRIEDYTHILRRSHELRRHEESIRKVIAGCKGRYLLCHIIYRHTDLRDLHVRMELHILLGHRLDHRSLFLGEESIIVCDFDDILLSRIRRFAGTACEQHRTNKHDAQKHQSFFHYIYLLVD